MMRSAGEILKRVTVTGLLFIASVSAATGHEFWISPESYRLAPGGQLVSSLLVGEDFKGNSMIYNPGGQRRFEVEVKGNSVRFRSIVGDDPALRVRVKEPGLHVISYYSTPTTFTFKSWDKFVSYVEGKGEEAVLDLHRQRGLPKQDFDEAYSRCAKALVQAGKANGQDRAVGLPLEFVAAANPYLDDVSTGLPVTLLWKGKPLAGAQIKVFIRGEAGHLITSLLRTDARGQALIDTAHKGEYLLNSVHLISPETVSDAAWESYWASLTFRIDP